MHHSPCITFQHQNYVEMPGARLMTSEVPWETSWLCTSWYQ